MRVPKGIMRVCDVAANAGTRYAFHGVRIAREKDGRCSATATDGRRLLSVAWTEETTAPLPGLEDAEKPKDGFVAIIPTRAATRADTAVRRVRPKKGARPVAQCVVIDEQNANGRVQLISPDGEAVQRIDVPAIEGQYPPYEDVIPNYKVIDPATVSPDKKKHPCVRVAFSASLMAELLDAMAAVVPDTDGANAIVMEVPVDPNRPIKLTRGKPDAQRRAVGVLMPVNMERAGL